MCLWRAGVKCYGLGLEVPHGLLVSGVGFVEDSCLMGAGSCLSVGRVSLS